MKHCTVCLLKYKTLDVVKAQTAHIKADDKIYKIRIRTKDQ